MEPGQIEDFFYMSLAYVEPPDIVDLHFALHRVLPSPRKAQVSEGQLPRSANATERGYADPVYRPASRSSAVGGLHVVRRPGADGKTVVIYAADFNFGVVAYQQSGDGFLFFI